MATFQDKLAHYEWWFYENGGIHIFNELQRFANKGDANNVTFAVITEYGDVVVSAGTLDVDSALVEKVHVPTPLGFTDVASIKNGGRPPTQATAP
jgi:hypothetical protein